MEVYKWDLMQWEQWNTVVSKEIFLTCIQNNKIEILWWIWKSDE